MATAFSSSPNVIVQKYNTGKACADAELSGITTYLADGKCHKTDTATSYRVTRSADNSASIKTYTDAVCTNGGVVTTVSTADGTSNACVLDAKVYGAGTTPLYLTSTVNYDTTANTCSSGTSVCTVMMGERYDDKADIFSLGIVLSELNTHAMPFAHDKSRDGSGDVYRIQPSCNSWLVGNYEQIFHKADSKR
ncbi:hypothetical protein JG688_00009545 [Phytophthora aleatoria]|uniref:Protein kinase domain-containing protein n=1 Tax=Phytophthora aleatoria TaxID=2496075 RepID=A0A8J5MFE8_9STRA|nr:hypothetical protein JG688_00009545 [Phytophthora aleatoria]